MWTEKGHVMPHKVRPQMAESGGLLRISYPRAHSQLPTWSKNTPRLRFNALFIRVGQTLWIYSFATLTCTCWVIRDGTRRQSFAAATVGIKNCLPVFQNSRSRRPTDPGDNPSLQLCTHLRWSTHIESARSSHLDVSSLSQGFWSKYLFCVVPAAPIAAVPTDIDLSLRDGAERLAIIGIGGNTTARPRIANLPHPIREPLLASQPLRIGTNSGLVAGSRQTMLINRVISNDKTTLLKSELPLTELEYVLRGTWTKISRHACAFILLHQPQGSPYMHVWLVTRDLVWWFRDFVARVRNTDQHWQSNSEGELVCSSLWVKRKKLIDAR